MFLSFTIEFSELKIKCVEYTVRLQEHIKEFPYIMVYSENLFGIHFVDITIFQIEQKQYIINNTYITFTGTRKINPLH